MGEERSSPPIPAWNFPERNSPGLKVTQIEPDLDFIAFELPRNPRVTLPNYRGEYSDYFFDSKGNPVDFRRHNTFDTSVQIGGDYLTTFRVHEWQGSPEHANLEAIIRLSETGASAAPIEGLISLHFKSMWNTTGEPFAKLEMASMGKIFGMDRNAKIISAPSSMTGMIGLRVLEAGMVGEGSETRDWGFNTIGHKNLIFDEERSNKVVLLDENGEPNSEIEWEVKEGILVYTQTHLPTGIRKVLRAPVKLDMSAVAEAVFAKPPYEKERSFGTDFLRVPWRHLPRIVGASLSFQYPKKEDLG